MLIYGMAAKLQKRSREPTDMIELMREPFTQIKAQTPEVLYDRAAREQ